MGKGRAGRVFAVGSIGARGMARENRAVDKRGRIESRGV